MWQRRVFDVKGGFMQNRAQVPGYTSRVVRERPRYCALCGDPFNAGEQPVYVEHEAFGGTSMPVHAECVPENIEKPASPAG